MNFEGWNGHEEDSEEETHGYSSNLRMTNKASLTTVAIPDSVESIGIFAFADCKELTSVTIPDSVTEIGKGAFLGCSVLDNATIPDSVTEIGSNAFKNCSNLNSVTIHDSVIEIGNNVFANCSGLTSVTISNKLDFTIKEAGFIVFPDHTQITIREEASPIHNSTNQ